MGLLDKAKAAASDLAAKADSAMNSMSTTATGAPRPADIDKYLRDLGVLTYLEASGRPADDAERERVLGVLRDFDAQGALRTLTLQTTPPPAPGRTTPRACATRPARSAQARSQIHPVREEFPWKSPLPWSRNCASAPAPA